MPMEIKPAGEASGESQELTVSQLTSRLKQILEREPELSGVWVRGEASNVRLISSGHLYFTLKDDAAQLSIAYFGFGRRKRKPPADGEALLVHGDVRVYERRGEYQLVADDLIKAGVGDLAAKFEALKRKLDTEGLFADERKVPVPAVPRRIAIITGAATAALQDVLNTLRRRAPYLDVVLFPSSVQGDAAPAELIAALQAADACPGIEVILLVRGGGSIEDLWCFNDEELARTLGVVERPVITGIGHEIDFTIADFVADLRAPTPTAAAELVAPDAAELRGGTQDLGQRLARSVMDELDSAQEATVRLIDYRLIRDVIGTLDSHGQDVDSWGEQLAGLAAEATYLGEEQELGDMLERLALPVARQLEHFGHILPRLSDDLLRCGRVGLEGKRGELTALAAQLKGLDPSAPKRLGFALVWDSEGRLVRSADTVSTGDRLRVDVQDGELDVERV